MSLLSIKSGWSTLTTARVKSVVLHPSQPIGYASSMNGDLIVFNKTTGDITTKTRISSAPIRATALHLPTNTLVLGDDDGFLHLIDANTTIVIKSVKAHVDFVRNIITHPRDNYCISAGDDSLIRLWSIPDLICTRGYEGHNHFVMSISWVNQDDHFISGSLDRKVKVWDSKPVSPGIERNISGPVPTEGWYSPMFTLEGHSEGVDCVTSLFQADRTVLISGSDDKTIRAWDPITKECIVVLPAFNGNLTSCLSVPELGLFIAADEENVIKFFDANQFSCEATHHSSLDRAWCLTYDTQSSSVIVGSDRGIFSLRLAVPRPPIAFDTRSRKLLLVGREGNNEIISGGETIYIAQLGPELPRGDGVHFTTQWKPKATLSGTLSHAQFSPNGQKIDAICGSEYVIITSLTGSTSQVGSCRGSSSAWSLDSKYYAVLANDYTITVVNGQEERKLELDTPIKSIITGPLLTVIFDDSIALYDWNTLKNAVNITVASFRVIWDNNCLIVLSDSALHVIAIDLQKISMALQSSTESSESLKDAYAVVGKIEDDITDFIAQNNIVFFVNRKRQLCYAPLSTPTNYRVHTLLSSDHDLLGYLSNSNALLLVNKTGGLLKYDVSVTLVELMTYSDVSVLLPAIEASDNLAFNGSAVDILLSRDLIDEAIRVCKLPEKLIQIYLSRNDNTKALELCEQLSPAKKEIHLNTITKKALKSGDWATCKAAAQANNDVDTLFVLASAMGNAEEISKVGDLAAEFGKLNIAFSCYFATGEASKAVKCLQKSGEYSSSAFFSYHQDRDTLQESFDLWKERLDRVDSTISDALLTPETILAKEREEEEAAAKAAREAEAEHVKEKVNESDEKSEHESESQEAASAKNDDEKEVSEKAPPSPKTEELAQPESSEAVPEDEVEHTQDEVHTDSAASAEEHVSSEQIEENNEQSQDTQVSSESGEEKREKSEE